jgi:hypothetical protein
MSGLREEREFGEELVKGIRVLWTAEVFVGAVSQSSLASQLPQVQCPALIARAAENPVGAGLPAMRPESQAGTVAFIEAR